MTTNSSRRAAVCLLVLCVPVIFEARSFGQEDASWNPSSRPHLASYAAALRLPDGHVDGNAMLARLTELGVTTYYWLIWRDTDWEDLQDFLPKAAAAGIEVWPYLVPPSESPPHTKCYSEPFRLDYQQWAGEIARLSLKHPNVTAWVIDDFYANKDLYTPEYVRGMQARAKALNPGLRFLPLMYFNEIDRSFAERYREVIDGVVIAYPQDREEIAQAGAILNDRMVVIPGQLRFPASESSHIGDFVTVSQEVRVVPGEQHLVRFRELDDFFGQTSGYHFKQVLIDNAVVWEQDAAGGEKTWQEVQVDVTEWVRDKTSVILAFRLTDKQPVGNFPLRWRIAGLQSETIRPKAPLEEPEEWTITRQGAFTAGFGDTLQRGGGTFHIPFIVMTAAQEVEFILRHGEPATPERMNDWLRMCLGGMHDGLCDGVVTYCLDLTPGNKNFDLAKTTYAITN